MRRKSFFLLIALLAVVVLVATACPKKTTTGGGGGGKTKVTFAFMGPLTGSTANLGIPPRNGAQLAIEQANASGDLDVEIVFEDHDTQGDPAQATSLKDQVIPKENVVALVGPIFSGETEAVLPDLETEGLAMISPSATRTTLTTKPVSGPKVFHRVVPDDDVQGQATADFATKVAKLTGVTYIHDNQAYGQALAEGTKDAFEKLGIKTIGNVLTANPQTAVYQDVVNAVVQNKPQAVYFGGYYDTAGKVQKQLFDGGFKGLFIGGDGVLDVGFVQNAGNAAAEGATMTCACRLATEDASNAKLAQFAKDYKAKFKINPGTYAVEGFDAANIFIEGLKAGNTTREKMLAFLEDTFKEYEGLSKKISFEKNGNVTTGEVLVYTVKAGKLELRGTVTELTGGGGATPTPSASAT